MFRALNTPRTWATALLAASGRRRTLLADNVQVAQCCLHVRVIFFKRRAEDVQGADEQPLRLGSVAVIQELFKVASVLRR